MKTKEIQFDGKKYCNRAASRMRMKALLTRRRKLSMTRCSTSRSRRIFSCLTRN